MQPIDHHVCEEQETANAQDHQWPACDRNPPKGGRYRPVIKVDIPNNFLSADLI